MKKKAFLVINIFKDESTNAHKVAGVFFNKRNAKQFIKQMMEENAEFIGEQLYKIEKYIFSNKEMLQHLSN